MPLGVADPDTDRGALPLPAEQLTLGVREPLQVVGMHELRAEGAAAHPGVGLPPEDLQAAGLIERMAPSASRMVMMSGEALITAWRVASRSRTASSACLRSVTSMA